MFLNWEVSYSVAVLFDLVPSLDRTDTLFQMGRKNRNEINCLEMMMLVMGFVQIQKQSSHGWLIWVN